MPAMSKDMSARPTNDLKLYALPGVYECLHPRVQGTLKIGAGNIGSAVTAYIIKDDGSPRVAIDLRLARRIA